MSPLLNDDKRFLKFFCRMGFKNYCDLLMYGI